MWTFKLWTLHSQQCPTREVLNPLNDPPETPNYVYFLFSEGHRSNPVSSSSRHSVRVVTKTDCDTPRSLEGDNHVLLNRKFEGHLVSDLRLTTPFLRTVTRSTERSLNIFPDCRRMSRIVDPVVKEERISS